MANKKKKLILDKTIKDKPFNNEINSYVYEQEDVERGDEQLKIIAEKLKLGLALHDVIYDGDNQPVDCRFIYINGIYEKITGLNHNHIIGHYVSEKLSGVDTKWLEKYRPTITTGQVVTFDHYASFIQKWFSITAYSPSPKRLALLLTDISPRKIAEEKLVKSEEDYRTTVNSLLIGVVVHGSDTRIIHSNNEASNILGLTSEQVLGKTSEDPCWKFVYYDGKTPLKIEDYPVNKVIESKKPLINYIIGVVRRDRDYITWVRCSAIPLYFSDGKLEKIIVSFVDITNQRKLEKRIIENARELYIQKNQVEATLMAIGDGVISTDEKGLVRTFNEAASKLTGWTRDEAMGKDFDEIFNIVNENTREKCESPVREVLRTGKSFDLMDHTILISRNKEEFYIEDSATPIIIEKNKVIGVVLVFRNVSEKVIINKKLDLEGQRLSRVIEAATDIIFEVNKEKEFLYLYGKGLSRLGFEKVDAIGRNVCDVFGEKVANSAFICDRALNGETYTFEWDYQRGDEVLWFETIVSPIYDYQKNITGALGVSREITERKQRQEEIEYLSTHDSLTSLKNRHYFVSELEKLDSPENYPLGLIMADLNGLKIFNDTFGHNAGDIALKSVAEVLKKSVRKGDVIARIGGDEFAAIAPKVTLEELDEIKNAIQKEVSQVIVSHLALSVAVGYEIKQNSYTNVEDVIKIAENRMYRRKLTESMEFRNNAVNVLISVLSERHIEEKIHCERVSQLCKEIGIALNLRDDTLLELEQTGFVHDIGKISRVCKEFC